MMKSNFVMKDAFWQIFGRMVSALSGFLIVIIMTPLLGPLRYGDYTTILSYFALWSALSDLGLYVIGLKDLGKLKAEFGIHTVNDVAKLTPSQKNDFSLAISQFVWARIGQIAIVYTIAIIVAYCVPSYLHNPYIARGLPLGMVFSALFMVAGIIQLPLQLFWKMEQVSIALILARVAQLAVLGGIILGGWAVYVDHHAVPMWLFLVMVGSVVVSSLTQTLYTLWQSNRVIRLRYVPFWDHMIRHIRDNGKYGAAFFLSSFHLLIVSLLMSVLYPTIQGYSYVGIWGLGLQLIQILLIIPAAIANSLIHKISALPLERQKVTFGHLMNVLIVFGWLCVANFTIFATPIVSLVSGEKYLTAEGFHWQGLQILMSYAGLSDLGTDFILPGLAVVLALSFVKTVFNYVFVAANRQNLLFTINLIGVVAGTLVAYIALHYYTLLGGLFAQALMEVLFVGGSWWYAKKYGIAPKLFFSSQLLIHIFFITIIASVWGFSLIQGLSSLQFILVFVVSNIVIGIILYPYVLKEFRHINESIARQDDL